MGRVNDDVLMLLNTSVTTLQRWVESRDFFMLKGAASAFAETQTWAAAVSFVSAADQLIHTYLSIIDRAVPSKVDAAEELLHFELGRVCMSGWMGVTTPMEVSVAIGLAAELRRWLCDLKLSGNVAVDIPIRQIFPEHAKTRAVIEPQAVAYVFSAALDRHVSEQRVKSYGLKLELIRSRLGLSRAELARLIGVSREGLRQWEGGAAIAPDRWPTIDKLFGTVNSLITSIKPEALPAVVRRPVAALNNLTPLDWLMSQRHEELLKFYERLFSYASTD